jgi:hypothetical protein
MFSTSNTISANVTTTTGFNYMSPGPITINTGITVTVANSSNYIIL